METCSQACDLRPASESLRRPGTLFFFFPPYKSSWPGSRFLLITFPRFPSKFPAQVAQPLPIHIFSGPPEARPSSSSKLRPASNPGPVDKNRMNRECPFENAKRPALYLKKKKESCGCPIGDEHLSEDRTRCLARAGCGRVLAALIDPATIRNFEELPAPGYPARWTEKQKKKNKKTGPGPRPSTITTSNTPPTPKSKYLSSPSACASLYYHRRNR